MKVKTDYVPTKNLWYLTPGKIYDVVAQSGVFEGVYIIDDLEGDAYIVIKGCPHLDGRPWDIVEE